MVETLVSNSDVRFLGTKKSEKSPAISSILPPIFGNFVPPFPRNYVVSPSFKHDNISVKLLLVTTVRLLAGDWYRPLFAFSSGNSVMNACESKSITLNGSTWNELNSNLYLRSLDRCYVPDDQAQRAWSTCGGTGNQHDSVPISGHVLGLPETLGLSGKNHNAGDLGITGVSNVYSILTATNSRAGNGADFQRMGFKCIEGASMDTGLARRMQNFYDQIVNVVPAATAAAGMI